MSGAAATTFLVAPTRRVSRPRTLMAAAAIVVTLVASGFAAGRGVGSSLAMLVASTTVGGNRLTAGTWILPSVTWYLHNRPSPPSGDTPAQARLDMDPAYPAASTLFNYDTDADTAPGRQLLQGGAGPGETSTAYATSWLSAPLAASRAINGSAMLTLPSATAGFAKGRAGGLVAYLRDYDPGTGLYTEIGSGSQSQKNWQGGSSSWVSRTISIAVHGHTVAAGHQIELKVVAAPSAATNMWIAYDTTAQPASIVVP